MGTYDQLTAFEASLTPAPPWPELAEEPMPLFPTQLLPEPCSSLAETIAASLPVPVDYAVCAMLGAASNALVGRVIVEPRKGHQERLQLYLCMGGESGTNKSGPMKLLNEPLEAWLLDHGKDILRRNRERAEERERLTAQARRKQHITDREQADIRRQLDALEDEPELPLVMTDTTPDALPRRMLRQGGVGIIYTDEGSFINILAGATYARQGSAPNLDTVLKGFDGGHVYVDRVTTEPIILEAANLSITVGMQPSIVSRMTRNSDLADRGFPQRVLYFLPDNMGKVDLMNLPSIPGEPMAQWGSLLVRLAEIHRDKPVVMPLTYRAQEAYNLHRQAMWDRPSTDAAMRAWYRKAHGKTARLAGLLALLENPDALLVEECHVRAAVEMMNSYFIPHAEKAFGGAPNMSPEALAMVDTLRRTGSITEKMLLRSVSGQRRYKGPEGAARFHSVLQELRDKGYIRLTAPQDTGRQGRKPSATVEVHPALLGPRKADIRTTEGVL